MLLKEHLESQVEDVHEKNLEIYGVIASAFSRSLIMFVLASLGSFLLESEAASRGCAWVFPTGAVFTARASLPSASLPAPCPCHLGAAWVPWPPAGAL